MRLHRPFAVVLAALAAAGGCAQLVGTGWTPAGGGGQVGGGGSGGATTTTTDPSTSNAASSAAASSSSGGCLSPTTCPGSDSACAFRTCVAGACGSAVASVHTPCAEAGGAVCNGAGTCVVCVTDQDCHGMQGRCVGGAVCESCDDGVQNGDETDVDCGGACQKCSAGERCLKNPDCAPHLKCENGICNEH